MRFFSKATAIALIVSVFLGACQSAESGFSTQETTVMNPESTTEVTTYTTIPSLLPFVEQERSVEGIFHFEQSPEDFLAALSSENIELSAGWEHISGEDGRVTSINNGAFSYTTDDIYALFDANGQLRLIIVTSDRYATDKGLRVGDSMEKMFQLYGEDFLIDPACLMGNPTWYFYHIDEQVVLVFMAGEDWRIGANVVMRWGIYFCDNVGLNCFFGCARW